MSKNLIILELLRLIDWLKVHVSWRLFFITLNVTGNTNSHKWQITQLEKPFSKSNNILKIPSVAWRCIIARIFFNAGINSFRRKFTVRSCLSSKLSGNTSLFLLFSMRSLFFYLLYPVGIYLLKVNNRNTRTRCEIR